MMLVILFIRAHLPTILIIQGVLAWVPYFYLKYMAQEEASALPFLAWHLMGVIPGAWMAGRGLITGRIKWAVQGED